MAVIPQSSACKMFQESSNKAQGKYCSNEDLLKSNKGSYYIYDELCYAVNLTFLAKSYVVKFRLIDALKEMFYKHKGYYTYKSVMQNEEHRKILQGIAMLLSVHDFSDGKIPELWEKLATALYTKDVEKVQYYLSQALLQEQNLHLIHTIQRLKPAPLRQVADWKSYRYVSDDVVLDMDKTIQATFDTHSDLQSELDLLENASDTSEEVNDLNMQKNNELLLLLRERLRIR